MNTPVVLLAAALVLALGGAGYLWRRLRAAEALAATLAVEAERRGRVWAACGEQFILWTGEDAEETVSPGLARLIGGDADPGDEGWIGTLKAGLGAADAVSLDQAVSALRFEQRDFDIECTSLDGSRILAIRGASLSQAGAMDAGDAECVLLLRDRGTDARIIEAMKASMDGLHELLDSLPIPVWMRSSSMGLEFVNRAYRDAVEAELDTPPGELPEIMPAGSRGEGAAGFITRDHIVIGGDRHLVELHEAPLAGNGDFAGYAVDRTEVENIEAELDRHITGHEDVLENLGTAIAIFSADESLLFFNRAYLQLWRLDEAWLRNQPRLGEILEEMRASRRLPEFADFPAFKAAQLKMFTSLMEPAEELVHLPDGTMLRSVARPHPFGGLMLTWEDVTDALSMEQSYNTLIAVQRETLDNLYEGIAVIGGDGRLRLSNPEFGKLWQIPEGELDAAAHIADIVEHMHPLLGDSGDWEDDKRDLIERLTARETHSGRIERIDGSILDFETVPLPDGAVLLSYLDISAAINMERALRERAEALETADRLKTEFIANVSYELRTPLNTIIGFTEILTGQYFGDLNSRQQEYGRGILESSNRLLLLINDILDLATIEAGHMTLELDSIDLHELLNSSLGLVQERARQKKLKLECDCPGDIGNIVADERRLKQVLFNTLSNAVKFTPENGYVILSARRRNGEVIVTTADNGIGITEEDRDQVFGKFEQGASVEARRSGVGLGLSLVRSFVELHGGQVEIESQPDVGTRIICSLPARESVAR